MSKPFADMTIDELTHVDINGLGDPLLLHEFTYELLTRYRTLLVSFDEVCAELDKADLVEWQNLSRA